MEMSGNSLLDEITAAAHRGAKSWGKGYGFVVRENGLSAEDQENVRILRESGLDVRVSEGRFNVVIQVPEIKVV